MSVQTQALGATEHEIERNAYNAAFHELGLRWHWDHDTYGRLLQHSGHPAERVRLYLQTAQPHLLKAYDADFLVAAIERGKGRQQRNVSASAARGARHFNWASLQHGDVGA